MSESPQLQPDAQVPDQPGEMIEVDATHLLDVVHKYVLDKPKTTINLAMGSEILCAKSQPDGTIAIWARRPIDENAPLCEIGIWVAGTGEPMPTGDFVYYLDTCMVLRPPSLAAPGAGPTILVWHVFVLTETLVAGNIKIAV